jgi:pimeloyl-ACP methyl ester carboxylesterase
MPPHEVLVGSGPVQLATTDHQGSGPSLVLLHGLGMSQRSMHQVAERLAGWRVITMDLRGHGGSTTAGWSFPEAVSDVQAVLARFDVKRPYLAGHSLGGMVALHYALAGLPVAGVINIDGWGPGISERYPGEDTAQVEAYLQRCADGHLPGRAGALIAHRTRQWREGTTQQVLRVLHQADVVAWHRAAPCPSLAVLATAPTGRAERWLMGAEVARRQDAHRRGLRRDLSALTTERPDVRVAEVDAGHSLIRTHPGVVAAAIDSFRNALSGLPQERVT